MRQPEFIPFFFWPERNEFRSTASARPSLLSSLFHNL